VSNVNIWELVVLQWLCMEPLPSPNGHHDGVSAPNYR